MIISKGPTIFYLIFGAALLVFVAFRASEAILPVFLVILLALGGCYRFDVAQKSFYIRFFFLGLVALRGAVLFIQSKRQQGVTQRFRTTPLHWGFLLTALIGIMGSLYSVDPSLAAQRAMTFLLLYFVVFVYFWLRSDSPQECEAYAVALWKSLAIILGIGFLFMLLGAPGMFSAGRLRLVLGNPNQLGHYAALMAPIAVWYLFEKSETANKYLAWGIVGALLVAIVWSGSRGALVGTLIILGLQFLLCYREKMLVMFIVFGLGASLHFLLKDPVFKPGEDPSFFEETVLREKTLGSGSGRLGVWKSATRLIEKQPLFGYGFGIVDRLFVLGYFPDLPLTFQGGHVHNGYLEELVNLGWIGTSPLFSILIYLMAIGAFYLSRPRRVTKAYRFTVALFSVMVGGVISGVFESWFTSVGSVFCFPFWFTSILFLKMTRHFNDWRSLTA